MIKKSKVENIYIGLASVAMLVTSTLALMMLVHMVC